jgi:hypothetical protein
MMVSWVMRILNSFRTPSLTSFEEIQKREVQADILYQKILVWSVKDTDRWTTLGHNLLEVTTDSSLMYLSLGTTH